MKNRKYFIVWGFLGGLTFLFCWLMAIGIDAVIFALDREWGLVDLPLLSRWTIAAPVPWQVLAVLSYVVNASLSLIFSGKGETPPGQEATPFIVAHFIFINFCLFIQAVGMLLPFIMSRVPLS